MEGECQDHPGAAAPFPTAPRLAGRGGSGRGFPAVMQRWSGMGPGWCGELHHGRNTSAPKAPHPRPSPETCPCFADGPQTHEDPAGDLLQASDVAIRPSGCGEKAFL